MSSNLMLIAIRKRILINICYWRGILHNSLKCYLVFFVFVLGLTNSSSASPISLDHGTPIALLSKQHISDKTVLVALGELAFKSEVLLQASRSFAIPVSCDSCHPDGGTTNRLFIEGLSGKPGTIDITNRAITLYEDGSFNPVNVPSIFGARHTAPYSRSGSFATLREFTKFVVVEEFGGMEPGALTLDALVAYEESLNFLHNKMINVEGKLNHGALEEAKRGEQVFYKRFPNGSNLTCASCHNPKSFFVDGKQHDVGTGMVIDTPTLRDVLITAPYMHDGRFDSLTDVVVYFDKFYELALHDNEKKELIAYLKVIGGGEVSKKVEPLPVQLETAVSLAKKTIQAEDWALGKMVTAQVVVELKAERARIFPQRKEIFDKFIDGFSQIDAYNKIENYEGSIVVLRNLEDILALQ